MTQIEIKGLDKLVGKLNDIQQLKGIKAALKAGGLHVKSKIAKYPPESEANMPRTIAGTNRTLSWYERGWGVRYIGGGGKKTSETLGRRWTVQDRDGGMTVVIGNNASYAEYVQSAEKQASFHERRNWITDEQVLEEERDEIMEVITEAVKDVLSK